MSELNFVEMVFVMSDDRNECFGACAVDLQGVSSRWRDAAVRIHDNLRVSDDGAVADAFFPLAALHQLGVSAEQLGVQFMCCWRLHLRWWVIPTSPGS